MRCHQGHRYPKERKGEGKNNREIKQALSQQATEDIYSQNIRKNIKIR